MTIADRAVGGVIVLDLDGQLSFGDTAACLREHLDSLLARDETRIILNPGAGCPPWTVPVWARSFEVSACSSNRAETSV